MADLISMAHEFQFVPSDPDDVMGTPSHACQSLSRDINHSSVHSPLP